MFKLCKKCLALSGLLWVVFGLLFLLKDLTAWNFLGINWWTIAFLLFGLSMLMGRFCPKCMELNWEK
jgi:hypothetical protein